MEIMSMFKIFLILFMYFNLTFLFSFIVFTQAAYKKTMTDSIAEYIIHYTTIEPIRQMLLEKSPTFAEMQPKKR